jgi:hypothetical protein
MSDIRAPVSACDSGDSQVVEEGTQSDHGVRFFRDKSCVEWEEWGRGR